MNKITNKYFKCSQLMIGMRGFNDEILLDLRQQIYKLFKISTSIASDSLMDPFEIKMGTRSIPIIKYKKKVYVPGFKSSKINNKCIHIITELTDLSLFSKKAQRYILN